MLSFLIPSQAGGAGGLAVHAAVVMEELCAACPGIANIFGAHALGISPLLLGGPSHWDGVLAELMHSERSRLAAADGLRDHRARGGDRRRGPRSAEARAPAQATPAVFRAAFA